MGENITVEEEETTWKVTEFVTRRCLLPKIIFLGEFKDLVEQKSHASVLIVQLLLVISVCERTVVCLYY